MSKYGTCKLTGHEGKFVKCHILPQAFTKPAIAGEPLIQGGSGLKPKQRWTSWYDKKLVTRVGEDVFSDLDDWAIKYLRHQRLVWSGFGPAQSIEGLCHKLDGVKSTIRAVGVDDPNKLRLFFLSLLWRAAATSLEEFSEIKIPESHLEKLAELLLNKRAYKEPFYPVSLVQMSTRGFMHNLTPIFMDRGNRELEQFGTQFSKVFRFYFDGLVILFPTSQDAHFDTSNYGNLFVGQANDLVLPAIPFENSFQHENLLELARTTDWT